jgi:hypothetical protein
MIRPRIMPYPTIHRIVRVSCALSAELPYCPMIFVFLVKEGDELVERVAVVAFRVGAAGTGGGYYAVGYIAEIEAGFWVTRAGPGDNLAEEGSLLMHCFVSIYLKVSSIHLRIWNTHHCRSVDIDNNSADVLKGERRVSEMDMRRLGG